MTTSVTTNRNRWAIAGVGGALVLLAGVIVGGILGPALLNASQVYVCDGKTFEGNFQTLKMDGGIYADPTVQKIVRNCTWKNGNQNAITINRAENVLITGSTFDNLHSGQNGVGGGGFGIYIRGQAQSHNITVENSTFSDLGADGLQVADGGRLVSNLTIRGNTFTGHVPRGAPYNWAGGENAVDIKGANGPVEISDNEVSGFLPCPNNGTAECSGSPGAGIVVHDGQVAGWANDVTLRANWFHHNSPNALTVSHSTGTVIVNNRFTDNGSSHVIVTSNAQGCTASGNTFDNTASVDGLNRCGAASSQPPTPAPTSAPTPSRTPSPAPTATPVPPTPTLMPSPSPTPSPTPTPTPAPSPSPTPAPTATGVAPSPAYSVSLSDYSVTRTQSFVVTYRTDVASRVRLVPLAGSCPTLIRNVAAGNASYPVTVACAATYRVHLRNGSGVLLASAPNLVVSQ